ncbi:MAG: F-box protein [Pseudomonadota bacterium]|nr:F-box protein [Pseudomonadota bacterium]
MKCSRILPGQQAPIFSLPNELIGTIFTYLSLSQVIRFSKTCHQFHNAYHLHQTLVLRPLVTNKVGHFVGAPEGLEDNTDGILKLAKAQYNFGISLKNTESHAPGQLSYMILLGYYRKGPYDLSAIPAGQSIGALGGVHKVWNQFNSAQLAEIIQTIMSCTWESGRGVLYREDAEGIDEFFNLIPGTARSPELAKAILAKKGLWLKRFHDCVKDTAEAVITAAMNDPRALKHASNRLKGDIYVCCRLAEKGKLDLKHILLPAKRSLQVALTYLEYNSTSEEVAKKFVTGISSKVLGQVQDLGKILKKNPLVALFVDKNKLLSPAIITAMTTGLCHMVNKRIFIANSGEKLLKKILPCDVFSDNAFIKPLVFETRKICHEYGGFLQILEWIKSARKHSKGLAISVSQVSSTSRSNLLAAPLVSTMGQAENPSSLQSFGSIGAGPAYHSYATPAFNRRRIAAFQDEESQSADEAGAASGPSNSLYG